MVLVLVLGENRTVWADDDLVLGGSYVGTYAGGGEGDTGAVSKVDRGGFSGVVVSISG